MQHLLTQHHTQIGAAGSKTIQTRNNQTLKTTQHTERKSGAKTIAAERHLTTMNVRPCYSDLWIHLVDSLLRKHVQALNLHAVNNEADISSHVWKRKPNQNICFSLAAEICQDIGQLHRQYISTYWPLFRSMTFASHVCLGVWLVGHRQQPIDLQMSWYVILHHTSH